MTIYFLAKYFKVPRDPRQTHKPGYMTNSENYALDENIKFARKLTKTDLVDHNVILNIFEHRIEKCNMKDMENLSYDEMFAYFYANYKNYFDRMFEAVGVRVDLARESDENAGPTAVTEATESPQAKAIAEPVTV